MIIIFILLGLGFLCGGAFAIVDGLPYMVLERGFTQVIIGTVLAVAGVLMLALSWVLVEFRRLKQTLSSAAMAMSVASAFASPANEREVAAPHEAPRRDDTLAGTSPGALAAGVGALAGAGAGLAAAQALGASQQPAYKPAEPDLFSGDTSEHAQPHAAETSDAHEATVPKATREADVEALPTFDPFRPVDPQGEPEPDAHAETVDAQAQPDVVAELAAIDESERDRLALTFDGQDRSDEGEPDHASAEAPALPEMAVAAVPGPSDIDDPFAPELVSPTPREPEPAREADEFGLLRASLTALQMDMEPAGRRIEPSFSGIGGSGSSSDETGRSLDDLAAAGDWMEPALQRRAPWFGETTETPREDPPHQDTPQQDTPLEDRSSAERAPEPAWPETRWPELAWSAPAPEPEALPWPPQAREAAPFESQPADPAEAAPGEQADVVDAPSFASDLAPAPADIPEPAPPEADAAEQPAAPEASDEGIVGAYQVGEAHFTIYADGSIQARTPDGDYSFASMDELKIYLASEKSRLGV